MNTPLDPVYMRRAAEAPAVGALRKRIQRARSRCLSRAERAISYDAGALMLRAAQIAAAWVWSPASEAQLEDVIALLSALHVAANAAERLERPDLSYTVFGDDDRATEEKTGSNPGREAAIAAATEIGAKVAFPLGRAA